MSLLWLKGETIELSIENLNHEGEGVGRFRGFTVFVPGAVPTCSPHLVLAFIN
ncbi:MAG: TRAM domain-containing protein [Dethiobacter sp.]